MIPLHQDARDISEKVRLGMGFEGGERGGIPFHDW